MAAMFFAPAPLWNISCLHSNRRTGSEANALFSLQKFRAGRETQEKAGSGGTSPQARRSLVMCALLHRNRCNSCDYFGLRADEIFVVEPAAECNGQCAARHGLHTARPDAAIHGDSH